MTCSREGGNQWLPNRASCSRLVNAFDFGAVNTAIGRVRPDAVIEELTSLPRDYTPEAVRAAEERDRKVRLEGGQNVYHAARTLTRRYLVQSTGFFYGPGARLASETDLLAGNASPGVSGSVRTYLQIEKRVLGSRDLEGVDLRYGFFYGPGSFVARASPLPYPTPWFPPNGTIGHSRGHAHYDAKF